MFNSLGMVAGCILVISLGGIATVTGYMIGAFKLLLDFDQADQMIRQGLPAKFAWTAAFGLTMTLVWLYVEILRLLWILNSD